MTAAQKSAAMTPDEFLRWEESQQERHELVDGEIFAMVGATLVHHRLGFNMAMSLAQQLAGRGCSPCHETVKVRVGENYFYPDVVVSCGRDAENAYEVVRPILIAEILSPSTETYDRKTKWEQYRWHLASLRTFMLVAQDRLGIEVYRRTGEGWSFREYTGADDVVEIDEPPCRLALRDVYGVYLEELLAARG